MSDACEGGVAHNCQQLSSFILSLLLLFLLLILFLLLFYIYILHIEIFLRL